MTIQRMPPVTIPLGMGLDEATARLLRDATQVIADLRNADLTKALGVRKARAFDRIALTSTPHGDTVESVFVAIGASGSEAPVVVGRNNFYAIAANAAVLDGTSVMVRRGPSMVGGFTIGLVHGSAQGSDT